MLANGVVFLNTKNQIKSHFVFLHSKANSTVCNCSGSIITFYFFIFMYTSFSLLWVGFEVYAILFDNSRPLFISSGLDLITFMDKPQFQFIAQLIL